MFNFDSNALAPAMEFPEKNMEFDDLQRLVYRIADLYPGLFHNGTDTGLTDTPLLDMNMGCSSSLKVKTKAVHYKPLKKSQNLRNGLGTENESVESNKNSDESNSHSQSEGTESKSESSIETDYSGNSFSSKSAEFSGEFVQPGNESSTFPQKKATNSAGQALRVPNKAKYNQTRSNSSTGNRCVIAGKKGFSVLSNYATGTKKFNLSACDPSRSSQTQVRDTGSLYAHRNGVTSAASVKIQHIGTSDTMKTMVSVNSDKPIIDRMKAARKYIPEPAAGSTDANEKELKPSGSKSSSKLRNRKKKKCVLSKEELRPLCQSFTLKCTVTSAAGHPTAKEQSPRRKTTKSTSSRGKQQNTQKERFTFEKMVFTNYKTTFALPPVSFITNNAGVNLSYSTPRQASPLAQLSEACGMRINSFPPRISNQMQKSTTPTRSKRNVVQTKISNDRDGMSPTELQRVYLKKRNGHTSQYHKKGNKVGGNNMIFGAHKFGLAVINPVKILPVYFTNPGFVFGKNSSLLLTF